MSDRQPMKVALVGLGTVGSGVARILLEQSERIRQRTGIGIEIVHAIVRDPSKPRDVSLPKGILATSFDLMEDPRVDVVCELIGGTTTAGDIVRQALNSGKHVVTANKALLCEQGEELFQLAREKGRTICFEAAVAGGVPIIEAVSQSLAANQITSIEAIINGTSNYILTEMLDRNVGYEDAVRKAQDKGYAEADPAMDVDGTDAAQKLTILAQLAFGTRVSLKEFPRQGIEALSLADLRYADDLGFRIKLLAVARLNKGRLELHTQPTLIRSQHPMADVYDAYNMIEIEGDAVGKTWFSGMGAGQMPTASAVVSDLIDLAVGRAQLTFPLLDLWGRRPPLPVLPAEEIERRYYLRFHANDQPGTMAAITNILGKLGISIASCIQHESEIKPTRGQGGGIVPLVIMTHTTTEGQMREADIELARCPCIQPNYLRLPIRG
ncbi:MAG: homoserine dehydrogenase [Planctomycetaceae bacterium]|nr:homoserine dehydrogenase [Planctomycetaceae bacterium]